MASQPKTVLLVEDDHDTGEYIRLTLQEDGYHVVLARDGDQALQSLRTGPRPDVILLDMLLPVLDGWHFLKRLRPTEPPVPVVVITATSLTREWALSHGCRGFLRKPIDADALLDELRLSLE